MEYLYYGLALILGFVCQKIKKITLIVLFIAYLLSICISNDVLLSSMADYTKLDKTVIIIICVLFYGSSTFSSTAIKSSMMKRMRSRVNYADYMMKIKVQEILTNFKKEIGILSFHNLESSDFFVSLFFVKGVIFKKLIRVGYADNLPKIITDWNGIIWRPKGTITGRVLYDDKISIVEDFDIVDLSGLPKDIQRWTKDYLRLRITIPIRKDYRILFRKREMTKFILCINSYKNFWEDKNERVIRAHMGEMVNIIVSYIESITGLYEYYSYI